MTIREALNLATKKLQNKNTSQQLDAEVLLSHVLDKPKEFLLANPDYPISTRLEKQFKILLTRRANLWPVAYLTHEKEFFGLKFYVDESVLIPRPETEGLVELTIDRIGDLRLKIKNRTLRILDIGTGSGAIIISLAKTVQSKGSAPIYRLEPINGHATGPFFFASDISKNALKIAKRNAKRHSVPITFKQGDLLKPWKNQTFDIIVANLPYLARQTDPSTKFEPNNSLVAKKQGLDLFEKLFKQVCTLSPLPSTLLLEIGHDQSTKIKNLAKEILPGYRTKILRDLTGRVRFAVLDRKSS